MVQPLCQKSLRILRLTAPNWTFSSEGVEQGCFVREERENWSALSHRKEASYTSVFGVMKVNHSLTPSSGKRKVFICLRFFSFPFFFTRKLKHREKTECRITEQKIAMWSRIQQDFNSL